MPDCGHRQMSAYVRHLATNLYLCESVGQRQEQAHTRRWYQLQVAPHHAGVLLSACSGAAATQRAASD
jgi:hypothetical protein